MPSIMPRASAGGFIEGRITQIEAWLGRAGSRGHRPPLRPDQIRRDGDAGRHRHGRGKDLQIVGETEADIERGLLNIRSPLARALIGKDEGDTVDVRTPGGERGYEVVSVRYV